MFAVLNLETAKKYSKEAGVEINEALMDNKEFKMLVYVDMMAAAS